MINLHQLMNELNKMFANTTYKASIDRNILSVNNQGSGGTGAQTVFTIDGSGNKSVAPGSEQVDNQITQVMRKLNMSESKKGKSAFQTVAEMVIFNVDVEMPTESLDPARKITIDELKSIMNEEFGKAKEVSQVVKAKELDSWGDSEIENQIDWMKALNICEFLGIEKKKI